MKQARKKDIILQAALECFLSNGYQNTSMEDIVKKSGVSKGGIYWHFKSKEDIFVYMIEWWTNDWLRKVNKEFAQLTDVKSKLSKYSELYCKSMDHPLARMLPELLSAEFNGENEKRLKQCFLTDRKLLAKALDEGISRQEIRDMNSDSDVLAHLFVSMLDGIAMRWITIEKEGDLHDLVKKGLDIFWEGIKRRRVIGKC